MFEVRTANELKDVYLPDDSANTRSLRDQEQPILAIRPAEANGPVGDRLHELGARRASALDERCLIDGLRDADAKEGAQPLDATTLGWLPLFFSPCTLTGEAIREDPQPPRGGTPPSG